MKCLPPFFLITLILFRCGNSNEPSEIFTNNISVLVSGNYIEDNERSFIVIHGNELNEVLHETEIFNGGEFLFETSVPDASLSIVTLRTINNSQSTSLSTYIGIPANSQIVLRNIFNPEFGDIGSASVNFTNTSADPIKYYISDGRSSGSGILSSATINTNLLLKQPHLTFLFEEQLPDPWSYIVATNLENSETISLDLSTTTRISDYNEVTVPSQFNEFNFLISASGKIRGIPDQQFPYTYLSNLSIPAPTTILKIPSLLESFEDIEINYLASSPTNDVFHRFVEKSNSSEFKFTDADLSVTQGELGSLEVNISGLYDYFLLEFSSIDFFWDITASDLDKDLSSLKNIKLSSVPTFNPSNETLELGSSSIFGNVIWDSGADSLSTILSQGVPSEFSRKITAY